MMNNDPLAELIAAGKSPPEITAAVAADAEVIHTPCGDGNLVWRRWGKGKGAPVVLVHGGSGSWTHWIKTVPALKQSHEVWAVDMPGLGDSDFPPHPHTPAGCGVPLALGIKTLIPKGAHLVAFSFGAHVSSHALLHLKDHVRDFTITGCAALGLPQGPGKEYPREMEGMTEDERMGVHRGLLEILMFKETSRIDALAVYLQSENIAKARFRSRPFARSAEIRQNLMEIEIPVKAVWGGYDQTAWPSIEARFDALREFHLELITRTVPDAGHWVMYEQPVAYNSALAEVLAL